MTAQTTDACPMWTLPGVFAPISDSWMLARAAASEPPGPDGRSLDLCTGSGVVAVAAARAGWQATAVDVSRRALLSARLNARRNGCRIRARRGHLVDAVRGERFGLVTANPPYVPSTSPDLPRTGACRAWEAGPDGRAVLDELCARLPEVLEPGGVVLLVHSSLIGEDETLERLAGAGLTGTTVVDRVTGPLGPLMREQQRAGTVAAHLETEDVVVVRAVASGG